MSADHRRPARPSPAAAPGTVFGVALGLMLGTLGAAPAARAQDAGPRDSLPARAGTYALEGGVGVNSTSLGVLRFLSPRSALGATLTGNYAHQSGDQTTSSNGGFALDLGYRRYGRLRDRITSFGTVGLTGGLSRYTNTQVTTTSQGTYINDDRSNYGSAGAFGELGASYLVVRRLAVNASALASVVGTFSRATTVLTSPNGISSTSARQNGVSATLGPVRFGLTLFL